MHYEEKYVDKTFPSESVLVHISFGSVPTSLFSLSLSFLFLSLTLSFKEFLLEFELNPSSLFLCIKELQYYGGEGEIPLPLKTALIRKKTT